MMNTDGNLSASLLSHQRQSQDSSEQQECSGIYSLSGPSQNNKHINENTVLFLQAIEV
jgi:hypothetical protein